VTNWTPSGAMTNLPSSMASGGYWARVVVNGAPSQASFLSIREVDPDPGRFGVGCTCDSSGSLHWAVGGLTLLMMLRRRCVRR
jgi:hypothetical protein